MFNLGILSQQLRGDGFWESLDDTYIYDAGTGDWTTQTQDINDHLTPFGTWFVGFAPTTIHVRFTYLGNNASGSVGIALYRGGILAGQGNFSSLTRSVEYTRNVTVTSASGDITALSVRVLPSPTDSAPLLDIHEISFTPAP